MNPVLDRDGSRLLRGLVSPQLVKKLRVAIDRMAVSRGQASMRFVTSHSDEIGEFAESLLQSDHVPTGYALVRSMLFDKTPQANWPVRWHQDTTICVKDSRDISGYGPWSVKDGRPHVQPPEELLAGMITLRVHLDHTTISNGALQVIPGSHRKGILRPDQISAVSAQESLFFECQAGDVHQMRPLLVHSSRRAQAPSHRRVLHFEFARSEALHPKLEWTNALP